MDNITIAQNKVECLREVNRVGSTLVMNICNGTSTEVPWGSVDWLGALALGILGLFVLLLLGFMVFTMFVAVTENW